MIRLWEDITYTDAPIADCWWAETVPPHDWAAPPGDDNVEVAIIGAGFTGLSAALHLAEAGIKALVLEAKHPYWGASGRNGGFCCLGGAKVDNATLTRRFGDQGRRDWRRTEVAAIDLVDDLLTRLGLDVDRHSEGETLMAHRPRDMEDLRADAKEIAQDYNVTPTLIERDALPGHGLTGPFHGALTTPIGFALNPRKYAHGLAMAAQSAGAIIHGQTPVMRIDGQGPYRLITPHGTVTAQKIILATNGYSSEDIPPWLRARTMPVQSSVIVTRPITPEEQAAQGWTSLQMCYDNRHLLHYFRLMPDGRMLFGMRGGLSQREASEARIRRKIRSEFEAMFPAWSHVETPYYWTGLVCLTRDFLPYVGPIPDMPGAFAALAYHGNGVAMGSYSGALVADLIKGPTERLYPAAMQQPPRKFPLGRYRRALMAPAYAWYGFKDR